MKRIILFLVMIMLLACNELSKKVLSNNTLDTITSQEGQKEASESNFDELNKEEKYFSIEEPRQRDSLEAVDFAKKTLDTLRRDAVYEKINLICDGEENYPSKCTNEEGDILISYKEILNTEKDSILITYKNKVFSFVYDTESDYGNEYLLFTKKDSKIVVVKKYLENFDFFLPI